MCEGYNNKDGSRPIWLEFRSSKWLIGWTAAVAAFTVCDLLIYFFRLKLCRAGGRYADVFIYRMALFIHPYVFVV